MFLVNRGQGLESIERNELQGLKQIMLAISDAHGLYQQFGVEKYLTLIFLCRYEILLYKQIKKLLRRYFLLN